MAKDQEAAKKEADRLKAEAEEQVRQGGEWEEGDKVIVRRRSGSEVAGGWGSGREIVRACVGA